MNEGDVIPAESVPLVTLPDTPPNDLDAEGIALRDFANKADAGQITQEELDAGPKATKPAEKSAQDSESGQKASTSGQQRAAGTEAATDNKPDNSETSAEEKPVVDRLGREHDPKTGKLLPKKSDLAADTKPEAEQKPETPYSKAQKEQEREKSVLAGFEQKRQAEWARIRAEDQRLAQERAQLQAQAQQARAPRFSSQDLWQAADEFDKNSEKLLSEGDLDGAKAQLGLARSARQSAQQSYYYEQQQAYHSQVEQHGQAWRANCAQIIEQNPELADTTSEVGQQMTQLLEQEPILGQVPDGFKKAWEIIQMRRDAAEVSGLREENEKLKQELKAERERTGLGGSGPTPHAEKVYNESNMDEWGEQLRRQAMGQDAANWSA